MKKLALVLGGGATKGYAHIGVLKVLEENGIKPDFIVGTSMGAVIGGAYACGKSSDYLMGICKQLTRNKLMDFNLFNAFFSTGVMRGKKLKKVLDGELGEITHKQQQIPFIATATNIMEGKLELMKEGLVVDSILASSAIPGVYPVVRKNNKILCDGGMIDNVPDDVAKKFAKNHVIVSVDVIGEYAKQVETSKMKIMELTINSLTLIQTELTKLKPNNSDLRIMITQPDVFQMSFDTKSVEKSIQYGIIEMKRNLPKLKKLLED